MPTRRSRSPARSAASAERQPPRPWPTLSTLWPTWSADMSMALVRLHYWVLVRWPSLLRRFHRFFTRAVNEEQRGECVYTDANAKFEICKELPPRPPRCCRIIMISDTHCGHRHMWVPDGDVLIHAGDFLAEWDHSEAQLSDFASWLASLPHAAKIVCAGNHDRPLDPSLDRDWRRHRATLSAVATYLDPSQPCATVFGLRVAASPVSRSRSASKNRAFQHIDSPTAAALGGSCDLLVTHAPPKGVLDGGAGLDEVRALALALQPRLHCFGHVHHTPGIFRHADLGRTIYCNAASCNWFWCAVRRPVVCDLPLTALETRILHAGRGYV